jgi:ribonucleotide monophosphatase NagD (HAD superfamily)
MKTGYPIDMDGAICREKSLLPGAKDFVEALIATGAPFIFLTSNSAPTPRTFRCAWDTWEFLGSHRGTSTV